MTEERAEYAAGTPGPIDPRDGDTLRAVMWKTSNNHARDIERFINDWEGSPPEDELHLLQLFADEAAATAVAAAVCPEHHAVYDTRTHVAVPVADIETWLPVADNVYGMGWMADWLRSLLPAEQEASR